MHIHILVKSPLLNKTLHSYLKDYIVSYDECDFVIADAILEDIDKPICLISFNEDCDIRRPIYRQSLFDDLDFFSKKLDKIESKSAQLQTNILDLKELETLKDSIDLINNKKENIDVKKEIESIVQDFANKLYEVISHNAK